jgi:hypothetical protein
VSLRFEHLLLLSLCGSVDGVDADELDAEVAQAVEQPEQLCLVGERAGERGLAGLRASIFADLRPADKGRRAAAICSLRPPIRVRSESASTHRRAHLQRLFRDRSGRTGANLPTP